MDYNDVTKIKEKSKRNINPLITLEYILNNFNGKIIHNLQLKFNRVRTLEEKYSAQKITKFTVSLNNY